MSFWKDLWNDIKGVGGAFLKNIPIIGPVFGALGGLFNKNKDFGSGATDLENGSGNVLNSLTGAIPGLVSAGSSMLLNNLSRKGDMKAQMQLMDYQNTLQGQNYERELADKKAMIEDDRQYNSIGAQMARADQAGVSPLAALGVSSGTSISATAPSHGGVSGHQVANNLLGTISTLKGLEMQKELNDAQVYRLEQAANLDKQKAETEVYNSIMRKLESENYPRETDARIREMLNRGDLAGAQKALAIAQTETAGAQKELYDQQAIRTRIQREYEDKFGRTMSNGVNNLIDRVAEFVAGTPKDTSNIVSKLGEGGIAGYVKRGFKYFFSDIFDVLKNNVPEDKIYEYAQQIWNILKHLADEKPQR